MALFTSHLLLTFALIPPWQQPDEHRHVAVAELHAAQLALRIPPGPTAGSLYDPAREGELLESMARYHWWEHRNLRGEPPWFLARDFDAAAPPIGSSDRSNATRPTYYLVVGRLLSWLPPLSVVEDLYILRAVSAIFGILTLWIAWLGSRECLGTLGGSTVVLLLALHPQFAIVSTAASGDALVNLAGACLWWQATVAVKRKFTLLPIGGMWCAALIGASADRMGIPLLAVAFVASIAAIKPYVTSRQLRTLFTRTTVVAAVASIGITAWIIDVLGGYYDLGRLLTQSLTPVPEAMTWDFFMRFTSFVHQSWWFSLGWVRYAPPSWWATTAALITMIAAIGAGRRLLQGRNFDTQTRTLITVAATSLVVQLSAVYYVYFRFANGAQGKSLFPVLVPCLVLLWTGIEAWVPSSRRGHAAAALIVILALLDATVWSLVAIPAYYASF